MPTPGSGRPTTTCSRCTTPPTPAFPAGHTRALSTIELDPQDANVGYVCIECVGAHSIWRSRNIQSASPTWEDVTYNLHRCNIGFKCVVHPLTGDAYFGNGGTGGMRLLKAPAPRKSPSLSEYFDML